ncbi:fluoride efflux transporter FluC [Tamaricihabitans halophyticus]|nr:CrcB family protein [Tamaricihabitans halophyticus]
MTETGQAADVWHSPARPAGGRRVWDVALVVAVGGALGSMARYAMELALPARPGEFPFGTFLSNVLGCLAIGALMAVLTESSRPHRLLRPAVGVGFIGGFTTLSTYVMQAMESGWVGARIIALSYLLGSLLCGLLAVACGLFATRRILASARVWRVTR